MLNLPQLVKITDDAVRQVPELFSIFKADFIDNTVYFMAYPIIIPRPISGEIYPEIFWHIISRQGQKDSRSNNTRLIDYERAKRLCWIKPIIQHFKEPEILSWRKKEFDKNAGKELYKFYLWYKNGKFMVILKLIETKRKKFFIATAFYVNDTNKDFYQKLYENGEHYPWT